MWFSVQPKGSSFIYGKSELIRFARTHTASQSLLSGFAFSAQVESGFWKGFKLYILQSSASLEEKGFPIKIKGFRIEGR